MANQIPGDFWTDVAAWLRQDNELAWVTDECIQDLNIDDGTLDGWTTAMQYQGFDVKRLLKVLKESYTNFMNEIDETSWTYTPQGGTPITLSNNWPIFKDMACLLMLFACRGSSWKKVADKSVKEVKDWMSAMKSKYSINTEKRDPGTSLGPTIVTLPRMAACMPAEVCNLFHRGYGRPLFTLADLGLPDTTSKACLTTSIIALLPKSALTRNGSVNVVFFLASILADDIIQPVGKKTPIKKLGSYYSASLKSQATPDAHRIKAMNHYRLLSGGSFIQNLITAVGSCLLKIRDLRGNDPDLDATLMALEHMTPQ